MNKKGFTLIELLAVLAIIAIVGMIAIPNVISLMENNKNDQMVNDAQRLISLAKNAVSENRDFRRDNTTSELRMTMESLDTNKSINPDPEGGDYNRDKSYVKYTKNDGYCVYLVGSKKVIKSQTGGCVKEDDLKRSDVKECSPAEC